MARRFIQNAEFTNVGVGLTATAQLPRNVRYHAILLEYREAGALAANADMLAGLNDISIEVNGKTQRIFSATQLERMNLFYGSQYGGHTGFLPIYFSEPWRNTELAEDLLAWGTAGVLRPNGSVGELSSFDIKVQVDALATTPTLFLRSYVDDVREPLGAIVKHRRRNIDVSATGVKNVRDFDQSSGSYLGIHYHEVAAADISQFSVTLNSVKIKENVLDQYNEAHLAERGFNIQASHVPIIFADDKRPQSALPMRDADGRIIPEFQVDLTMATTNNPVEISELFGVPD